MEGQIFSVQEAIEAKQKKPAHQMKSSLKSYEGKIGLLQNNKDKAKPLNISFIFFLFLI